MSRREKKAKKDKKKHRRKDNKVKLNCDGLSFGNSDHEMKNSNELICVTGMDRLENQIFLEQIVNLEQVNRVGHEIIYVLKATNISGLDIKRPLVISSSLLGTKLLSIGEFNSGETIVLKESIILTDDYLVDPIISSVAFVAYGIETLVIGNYNPGLKISNVVVSNTRVILPQLDISGKVESSPDYTKIFLKIKNNGILVVDKFILNIPGWISKLESNNIFELFDNLLRLKSGLILQPDHEYNIIFYGSSQTTNNHFIFQYNFKAEDGSLLTRSIAIPVQQLS